MNPIQIENEYLFMNEDWIDEFHEFRYSIQFLNSFYGLKNFCLNQPENLHAEFCKTFKIDALCEDLINCSLSLSNAEVLRNSKYFGEQNLLILDHFSEYKNFWKEEVCLYRNRKIDPLIVWMVSHTGLQNTLNATCPKSMSFATLADCHHFVDNFLGVLRNQHLAVPRSVYWRSAFNRLTYQAADWQKPALVPAEHFIAANLEESVKVFSDQLHWVVDNGRLPEVMKALSKIEIRHWYSLQGLTMAIMN